MQTWQSPEGPLSLGRFPYDMENRGHPTSSLQAWNGADTLLAEHLKTVSAGTIKKVLLLNDQFGALTCFAAKCGHSVRVIADSRLSRDACLKNLELNRLKADEAIFLNLPDTTGLGDWHCDIVLMQIPKSNALLEYQLALIADLHAGLLAPGTEVCAGGMTRDIHNSTSELFTSCIGTSHTSLAAHKARLVHSIFTPEITAAQVKKILAKWPQKLVLTEVGLPEITVCNLPGVFSASGHDKGSLLLLRCLKNNAGLVPANAHIIDCGCGNGLLSLAAAKLFPDASFVCTDESLVAIESTRLGFVLNGINGRGSFLWTDCLEGVEPDSADMVLCNPPFHQGQGQTQTLEIARRMFEQSKACLKSGATLLVVANKHLGHHRYLEDLFGRSTVLAESDGFVIISALKA